MTCRNHTSLRGYLKYCCYVNFNIVVSLWNICFDIWKHRRHDQAMKKAPEHIEPHIPHSSSNFVIFMKQCKYSEYTSTKLSACSIFGLSKGNGH